MPTSISKSRASKSLTSRRLCRTVSPPSATLSKAAVHPLTRPLPTPYRSPRGSSAASPTPALFAACSDTMVLAPESNKAKVSWPFTLTTARMAGVLSRRSRMSRFSRISSISETGVSPAQYAMLALPQSSLGITNRIMPCARSYSVSKTDRMLRPIRPMPPRPESLPPTRNSMSASSPPRNCTWGTVVLRGSCMWPARPSTVKPKGRLRSSRPSCSAEARVRLL